ncbi:MAG TPA: nucleotidyl transferase AbiEii/AbiGii toxin family protein [Anaerovoracaceae bacterium]|nr:nucleotidyl transferase AbiEii/AbiGii toxin family protein [Anaerovoracaceae bacterium]
MRSVASVKDRLKNRSRETGKSLQELFTVYGLERTIYRLSISRYVDNFTLKGGIFLYALFEGNYARATTDIDFLAQKISNEVEDMKAVFTEIFSLKADDPLRFDLESLNVIPITEFKKYHGVNVSIKAYLDRTEIPISIDIGFGDVIVPGKTEMDFPVLISDDTPRVYAYSLASSIAEKFEAIVSLAYDNSRFKDYYDIYVLAHRHNFDGAELADALKETFENRHTSMDDIVAFEDGFADDPLRQSRWQSFVKKKKAMLPVTMEETIESIQVFLLPVVESIRAGKDFQKDWDYEKQMWI